ncbi:VOC family protein [Achromobacter dolens]|uniref:VOC family protein n=1 Tax=Achromobacter dolens TaxID=1287738 RepID=UPI000AC9D1D2|nr:VOC family protein [Achromobacter dolens]
MSAKNFVIFYVDKPEASAAFYSALLNRPPVESSPTFALFALDSGLMLGLWSRHTVEPAAAGRGGCTELAFTVPDADALNQRHLDWSLRGLPILQAPTNMDFGRTFVALDPDGHRLRVFAPAPEPTTAAGEDELITIPAFPGA